MGSQERERRKKKNFGSRKRKSEGSVSEGDKDSKCRKLTTPRLGVILVDSKYPVAQGDIASPHSFDCDVFYKVVPDLTFEMCKNGKMTKEVEKQFRKSIKWLVQTQKVNGITGDCGFMINFQSLARQITKIPIFMSSLCQLPAVMCGYAKKEQIIIMTANRKSLKAMRDLIRDECGVDTQDKKRYKIVGCEDVPHFGEAVEKGEKAEVEEAQLWIVRKAFHALKKHPKSKAFLLECTELSPYAYAIRFYTGLPVYDSITACQYFLSGSKDEASFGSQDFQPETCHFENNLMESESFNTFVTMRSLARLLQNKKNKSGDSLDGKQKKKVRHDKNNRKSKIAAPCLGVIRLDYKYPPAPGDIDHPDSFDCHVFYKVVPGLTFEMCKNGKMTEQVEERFKQSIKWLVKKKKVNAITGDCGFMMYFQGLAREVTNIPVVMSSLCQLPAITCSYAHNEQVIIMTANRKSLEPMRDLIRDECGVDTQDEPYNIVGCEDVPHFGEAVAKGEKVNVENAQPWIVRKALHAILKYPRSRAFLLECTELPPFANAIRFYTGLPVYDSITACHFLVSGSKNEAMFGLHNWQDVWDGKQEPYTYGDNLTESEKKELVNPIRSD